MIPQRIIINRDEDIIFRDNEIRILKKDMKSKNR